MGDEKAQEIFKQLEEYGVRHEDPYLRNITYRPSDGQFCIIDFEFATILEEEESASEGSKEVEFDVTVEWDCKTDVGRFRKKNEDEFLALSLDREGVHFLGSKGSASLEGYDLIFAVSDGMGGARSGEFASRIAVEKITGSTAQGVTSKGNVAVLISNTANSTTSTVNFFNGGSTSQSGGTNVSAAIQVVKKGMRLVDNENFVIAHKDVATRVATIDSFIALASILPINFCLNNLIYSV